MYLVLKKISKSFRDVVAVNNVSLEVKKGEWITVLGPSGCGKTTLLRIIAGLEQLDSGQLFLEGQDITYVPSRYRNIGLVFQSYALFPNLDVFENIAFGLRAMKMNEEKVHARVNELLEMIRLKNLARRFPHQLSGGQQQRVALARAVAPHPRVLLLDEPLSALDAAVRQHLRWELRRIQQVLGITTILVTHDQEEALAVSDRIVIMNHGNIEQIGTPFDIYSTPATAFVASFVGTSNIFKGIVVSKNSILIGEHETETMFDLSQKLGEEVLAHIRPEDIKVSKKDNGEEFLFNKIPGIIQTKVFLGAVTRLWIKISDGLVIVGDSSGSSAQNWKEGENIFVLIPPHALRLLDTAEVPKAKNEYNNVSV
ncbi:MAG: ABC transporter ATP-binding protein [Firmicutes bacterium]|nr:ABC transporter ATP-binding protein [Bacillota bacterium]